MNNDLLFEKMLKRNSLKEKVYISKKTIKTKENSNCKAFAKIQKVGTRIAYNSVSI